MESRKFCLKWDGFQSSVTSLFDHLRQDEELVDITLCCEGQRVKAHRMMLSACSPYFRDLFKENQCQQMVIFLKDTSAADLLAIIEFMYKGSVNVAQSQLASFIKTAEMLQIRGLSGDEDQSRPGGAPPESAGQEVPGSPPAKRRRRSNSGSPLTPATARRDAPPPAASAGLREPGPPLPPPTPTSPPAGGGSQTPPHPPELPLSQPPAALPAARSPLAVQVKVEKTEMDLISNEVSLDATLGYVAEYEGGYAAVHPSVMTRLDPNSHDRPAVDANHSAALQLAGPSQPTDDDGVHQGADDGFVCGICGNVYQRPDSLKHHTKKHLGMTTCRLCGKVCSIVADLRKHLHTSHKLSTEQVHRLVPTRPRAQVPQHP